MVNGQEVRNIIAISLGAVAGALTRYYLSLWFLQKFGSSFPYGAFFINLTGCLVMGLFATLAFEKIPTIPPEIRLLVAVGFLGSYTTFSTYGLDTILLLRTGNFARVALYWLGSAVLGVIGIQLGVIIARVLWK
jgi:fluoride exporter